ncbi:hypothetical protein BH09BAC2_BH09BAC2_20600 [soil metagenome]
MNTVFTILPENLAGPQTNLLAEISSNTCSYLFQDAKSKEITGLGMYNFEKEELSSLPDTLLKLFSKQEFKNNFNAVKVSYAFEESTLIPYGLLPKQTTTSYSNELFGQHAGMITMHDELNALQLQNIYRVTADIHRTIINKFPLADFQHYYTVCLKSLPDTDGLTVHLYDKKLLCVLMLNGKLQLINSYKYLTAEDAVYHLLNIQHQHDITDLPLELSGMIEKESGLYKEIRKYFSNISFSSNDCTVSETFNDFPGHYFKNLYRLATCE